MGDFGPTVPSLLEDLDASQRRRLWLLEQVIKRQGLKDDLESTLAQVKRLEEFIANGRGATEHTNGLAGFSSGDRPSPLLDAGTRQSFIEEAIRDPDNRRLAVRFGLSVRQAHAIRIAFRNEIARRRQVDVSAMSSRNPMVDAAPSRAQIGDVATPSSGDSNGRPSESRTAAAIKSTSPVPVKGSARLRQEAFAVERVTPAVKVEREEDLRLGKESLAAKPTPEPTLQDVVGFLRQTGDVVVGEGNGYRVNYSHKLTAEQLVARANQLRRRRGQQEFVLRRSDTPPGEAHQVLAKPPQ